MQVKALNVPASESFDFCLFLADPSNVRDWNIQGLPADAFSTENGVMVTRGRRWPLMIDPQVREGYAQCNICGDIFYVYIYICVYIKGEKRCT